MTFDANYSKNTKKHTEILITESHLDLIERRIKIH